MPQREKTTEIAITSCAPRRSLMQPPDGAHDFRRTAVRTLERAGVPRSVAMKLVGHKTEAIYRRYAIVSESDLREGAAKLAALHAAASDGGRTVVPLSQAPAGRRASRTRSRISTPLPMLRDHSATP